MKKGLLIVFLLTCLINIGKAQVSKTQVGATYYDLQTNGAIERRIVLDPISKKRIITYTGSVNNNGYQGQFTDRGTGYYYYSGVGPITPQTTFPGRIEANKRVGWPNPLFLAGGKEMVVSHISDAGFNGLYTVKRNAIGTGTWIESSITQGTQTWPRAANSGDSIFVISSIYTQGNTSNFYGMLGGIGFKRSYNGGVTWTPDTLLGMDSITGLNLAKYPNLPNGQTGNVIGGDNYALDVKGKTVAVLTGANDVTLFLSKDFGNTWEMTTIIDANNNSGDTLPYDYRANGDFSVLIDNNDKIHCFWGSLYNNGYTINLFNSGIVYWNNITPGMKPTVIRKTSYGRENNTTSLMYFPYRSELYTTQILMQTNPTVGSQRFYRSGYVCNPSTGVDASNTIYMSYQRTRGVNDTMRMKSKKIFDANGNMFNDCYIVKSKDNGQTWEGPINVSNSDSTDDAYPSIARFVDDSVHIVYQEDNFAGSIVNIQATSADNNRVIYARVATKDIVNLTDYTPPILTKKTNISTASNGKITSSSGPDTLRLMKGCNLESVFQSNFGSIADYCMNYVVEAYDDNNKMTLKIDTPAGFSPNTPGVYRVVITATDANNNKSELLFTNIAGEITVNSWDTLELFIVVDDADVTPPTITLSRPDDYIKVGTPYALPSPFANFADNNPCGAPIPTLPSASQVDVNKIGQYNLVVSAVDVRGNKATDTFKVYVGDAPNSDFSNQAIANGKITATGTTSEIASIFPNTSYAWKTKTATGIFADNLATTKDLNFTIATTTKSFDSLCYEVKNIFNSKLSNLKVKTTCKALKYVKGGGGTVGIQVAGNNAVKLEIAPNPNSGNFKLQYEGITKVTEAKITIQDINGKTIYDHKVSVKGTGEIPVQLTNVSNGFYFINAQIGENNFLRKLEISK